MDLTLNELVGEAARRGDVFDAVSVLYARVQGEIDARRPLCIVSGRCCQFETYGHRLYVTTMELAVFVRELQNPGLPARENQSTWDGKGCPFQVGKLCGVHAIRPFGCRMFFCDVAATLWQNETYERFHAELKELHDRLAVPYRYVEWRAGLRALGLADEVSRQPDLL